MIKLVMCSGDFPIELVATNFADVNECADGTSNCSAVSIPKDHIAANANLDLLGMDGLAKIKQSLQFLSLMLIN